MAISKSELAKFSEDEVESIDAEERKIDAWLKTRPPSLCYNVPTHLNRALRSELLRRYREAGWAVDEVDDQRDDNFWTFK